MGGDHKCPVCQATFTRPQHVARHMRSHTGDRPYKCQYCGDQFARSDLLSRHINKCHANEKPAQNTGRRKGSASASRATTSKQACDQCVQSSLPCDGCNPCSKCVQRKCRCTFVKFHRQTAPVGPGHHPRPPPTTVAATGPTSRYPLYPSATDDFLLGPSPSTSAPSAAAHLPPSLSESAMYAQQNFTFSPVYAPHHPQDPSSSAGLSSGMQPPGEHPADYTAKYRAQVDLLRRNGLGAGAPNASSIVGSGFNAMDPAVGMFYGEQRPSTQPSSSSSWLSWTQQDLRHYPPSAGDMQGKESHHDFSSTTMHIPPPGGGGGGGSYSTSFLMDRRRASMDFSSDGSGGTSQSIPSSATSSSVHLPIDTLPSMHHHHPPSTSYGPSSQTSSSTTAPTDPNAMQTDIARPGSSLIVQHQQDPQKHHQSHPHQHQQSHDPGPTQEHQPQHPHQLPHHGQHHGQQHPDPNQRAAGGAIPGGPGAVGEGGGFSSAFGLMSLDDPNVLAGLSADGAPFFTEAGMSLNVDDPDATPMPPIEGRQRQAQQQQQQQQHPQQQQQQQQQQQSLHGLPPIHHPIQRASTVPTPSRDVESRELREFWKQYMRTPPSGPGSTPAESNPSGGAGVGNGNGNAAATPAYRRPRVASLPSAKTPTGLVDNRLGMGLSGAPPPPQQQQQQQQQTVASPDGMSSIRTTLHGNVEDLRSYEAAVLARNTPLNLSLKPRQKKASPLPASAPGPGAASGRGMYSAANRVRYPVPPLLPGMSRFVSGQPHVQQQVPPTGSAPSESGMSRPGSSLSAASELANVFGKAEGSSASPPSGSAHLGGGGMSSRESSISGGEESSSVRPSFKRLPSQTLGPANVKRAQISRNEDDGDGDDEAGDDSSDEGARYGHEQNSNGRGEGASRSTSSGAAAFSSSSTGTELKLELGKDSFNRWGDDGGARSVNLAERRRRRRMSAPTTSPTASTFASAGHGAN